MTPHEFISKWKDNELSERASAQEHFIDLCRLIGHPTPKEADAAGETYAFEKGVAKTGGGDGFADVWKRGHFAWEYKKKKRNLDAALEQLTRYASALENPPLHVACDTGRFKIVTAWTNTLPKTYEFGINELGDPEKRGILHAVFHDPEQLRPASTRATLTQEAAKSFITITERMQHRAAAEDVAHFVNQLVFCFFAEDVKLLPEDYFTRLLKTAEKRSHDSKKLLDSLFAAMEGGGFHGVEEIAHFNGGLFDGRRAIELEHDEIRLLVRLAKLDWSMIDPTIFGTLFERFLDPAKRAQIGAHYTDPAKIMMIVEPVIARPLNKEWQLAKARIAGLLDGSTKPPKGERSGKRLKPLEAAEDERAKFIERLKKLSILDPACGSGNFLYLALHAVKDIENRALLESEAMGLSPQLPMVGPEILRGIEINAYAAELARTTIWIGYIQWKRANGIYNRDDPILRRLENIECRDALVTTIRTADGVEMTVEAQWPQADFIVGNPPFLGAKRQKSKLGRIYTSSIRSIYSDYVPGFTDLVCFWFVKSLKCLNHGHTVNVGLVATNSIRKGTNLPIMRRINEESRIYDAWSEQPWVVDGVNVDVSIICFGNTDVSARLDGNEVDHINPDLTSGVDIRSAKALVSCRNVAFLGIQKSGPFDANGFLARKWLQDPINVNKRPNSDIIFPYWNGDDVVGRNRDKWIVYFWPQQNEEISRCYEGPFNFLLNSQYGDDDERTLREARLEARDDHARIHWWKAYWPRYDSIEKIRKMDRYLVTNETSQYRVFVWLSFPTLPDKNLIGFLRDDDCFFGILHSHLHREWSLRMGSDLQDRPRYTSTTTFDTFPFPEGLTPDLPASAYADDPRAIRIAACARELDDKRRAWLNPPDLVDIVPEIVPTAAPGEAPVKYPDRILPKSEAAAAKLKTRTLTNLYNERPAWLAALHDELDRAVAAAYGWPEDISTDEALKRLLALNLERAEKQ